MTGFLTQDLTTIAFCWRLDRRDGVSLGFTSHDRDLEVDGLIFRAAPGMLPSAIGRSDGFDVDSMDVQGALSDRAIRAADLEAGRWDGAAVRLYAINWRAPAEMRLLMRGELGAVEMTDGSFSAELRGPTAILERPVVEVTAPECRAELGDGRCRIDLSAYRETARIVTADDALIIVDVMERPPNHYTYGRLRWLTGANSGLAVGIAGSNGATLRLRDIPHFTSNAGDRVEITAGCDKRFTTCRTRFNNVLNFRAEPHLPGNDLLTRYPGG